MLNKVKYNIKMFIDKFNSILKQQISYFQKISITPYLFIIYKSTITFNKLKRKIKNIILTSTEILHALFQKIHMQEFF